MKAVVTMERMIAHDDGWEIAADMVKLAERRLKRYGFCLPYNDEKTQLEVVIYAMLRELSEILPEAKVVEDTR